MQGALKLILEPIFEALQSAKSSRLKIILVVAPHLSHAAARSSIVAPPW